MFSNLLKTLNKSYTKTILPSSSRYLCSGKDFKPKQNTTEEEAALKIEASLFDNSSVKYEPTKKEEVLKKTKQKPHKSFNVSNIISKPQQFPSFKKSRSERQAESKVIHDEETGLEFLKLSLNDPRLSTLLITARSKKRRDKDRQIIIEGRRLILEALDCGLKLNSLIFSQKDQLLDIKDNVSQAQKQFNTKIYKVPHHDLKTWSTLTTPPGIMAIFERPALHTVVSKMSSGSDPLPITVVCDNIREPNNLGSIIRTCAALPCLQIVITKGCCDPWESKALRGGCGGHFRVPIRDDVDWQDVPLMIPPEVADNCCIFVAENNLEKLENKTASVVEYSEVEKTGSHNVVIIGGESHGVSEDAYRFLSTVGTRGTCLNIPLAQGIDSLNVASALTLILYELRKNIINSQQQLLLKKEPKTV
ncbi:putative RNA methyltransferase-like protein 1 [Lucilia cuprina]|uniref:Putative RNA methyltransferase-like protein 1 n=1 Tax=Lucilia cuprina TaxID=7375 RepID=A0A0L0CRG9_LUCCU|nr:mitochondrial, rRNA methyltransferase 3 [Lucilia cuprina]KNC34960.1 putative RNA methyltransferase-like protein 1 [Lucilia cuprina]